MLHRMRIYLPYLLCVLRAIAKTIIRDCNDDYTKGWQDLVAGSHIAGSRNVRPLTPWAL